MNMNNTKNKEVSLKRFFYDAVSELWSYKIWTFILICFLIGFIKPLAKGLIGTRDDALTTSNLTYVLFSPQGVAVLLIAIIGIFVYIAIEVFGEILFVGDLFENKKTGSVILRILSATKDGFKSLKLFLNPHGIICLLYIFIITPIIGIGFSISLTDEFYIPHFIMDVIDKNLVFAIPFFSFIIFLIVIGVLYIYTYHGVLLHKESVKEAMKKSRLIIMQNWKTIFTRIIKLAIILTLVRIAVSVILEVGVAKVLESWNSTIPQKTLTSASGEAFTIRTTTALVFLECGYIEMIIKVICDAVFMLDITRFYLECSRKLDGKEKLVFREPEKRVKYIPKVIACILGAVLVAGFAIIVGFTMDEILYNDKTAEIVAHRAGGFLASENSIDGLNVSIQNKCFGAETDIQRTKDGYYIINHDDDFGRLTGVAKAPKDMTLAEIKELKIKDTTGSGKILQVPTLEEFLDTIKGKIKLFIELKGVTADKKMVDDVVRIVKEKGCENDVVLISLKYDIMNYAEETYGEMDTGVLCFGGFGNVADLHVDYMLMEEEMAGGFVDQVESNGKTSGIWTVNTERGMTKAFDMGADTIITDDINLYYKVKEKLGKRTDFQILYDWCENFFE